MSQSFTWSQQVRFLFLALIGIALEHRRDLNSKAHFVAFNPVMSILLIFEYSLAYLRFILSSIRSISIEKERFIKPKGGGTYNLKSLPSTVHNFRPQTSVHICCLTISHSLRASAVNELKRWHFLRKMVKFAVHNKVEILIDFCHTATKQNGDRCRQVWRERNHFDSCYSVKFEGFITVKEQVYKTKYWQLELLISKEA